MGLLDGKVAIITGGGSGIGKAIAEIFVTEGCALIIAGRTADKLNFVLEKLKKLMIMLLHFQLI